MTIGRCSDALGVLMIGCHCQQMEKVVVDSAEARLAVANDGSPQVFYFLPGIQANLWVLALERGLVVFQ